VAVLECLFFFVFNSFYFLRRFGALDLERDGPFRFFLVSVFVEESGC